MLLYFDDVEYHMINNWSIAVTGNYETCLEWNATVKARSAVACWHCSLRRILNFHRIGLFRGSMSQKLPFSLNICFNIKHLIVQICSFSWICILNFAYFLINLFISVLLTSSKNVFLHFTVRHSFMFVFMNA